MPIHSGPPTLSSSGGSRAAKKKNHHTNEPLMNLIKVPQKFNQQFSNSQSASEEAALEIVQATNDLSAALWRHFASGKAGVASVPKIFYSLLHVPAITERTTYSVFRFLQVLIDCAPQDGSKRSLLARDVFQRRRRGGGGR